MIESSGGEQAGRAARRRFGLPWRRLLRDRRGSVAQEFAMLVLPFMVLIFATLESCISFAAQEVLANATDDVARMLRTGQVRAADIDETKLKGMICERIQIMVASGCPELVVDLRQYDTFADAAAVRVKIANGDLDTSGFAVKPGATMSKNMLRVFYRWPVVTNFVAKSMSNLNGYKTLHFASVTWQNEPFND